MCLHTANISKAFCTDDGIKMRSNVIVCMYVSVFVLKAKIDLKIKKNKKSKIKNE